MNKIYLFAGALCISAGALAQNLKSEHAMKSNGFAPRAHVEYARAEGDILWEDEFDNAGDWTTGNGGVAQDWVVGTNVPSGGYAIDGIASPTAANGFAMFDSDGLGDANGGQDAWLEWSGATIATTGATAVTLEFYSYYRAFNTSFCYVEVSQDGGTSYPFQYPVHTDITSNNSTTNPEIVRINISNSAANQADVKIRFRYVGDWDYAWMVDDVKITESYENEMSLVGIGQRGGEDSLDIYAIPTSQKDAFLGWNFGAKVSNNGSVDQTNTRLNVTADNGSGYDQNSVMSTLNSGTVDSFEVMTPFMTTTDGDYTVAFAAISDNVDAIPEDNLDSMTVTVGGYLYARDNGTSTGRISNVSSQPGLSLKIGNYFEIFDDMSFSGVDLALSSTATNEGQLVSIEVQYYNTATEEWEYLTESEDITVTAGMLNAFTTYTLDETVNVSAGDYLLILARHYGGTNEVEFLYAQNTVEGSVLGYDDAGDRFQLTEPGAIMIRINEDPAITAGINEETLNINSSVYPNPAKNNANVEFTLVNSSKVTMSIIDINGQVVYSNDLGTVNSGAHIETINTAKFANGMYYINMLVDGQVSTQKFAVSH